MKKSLLILTLAISITAHADNSWWELGAAAIGVGIALSKESRNIDTRDAGRNAEIIMGGLGKPVGNAMTKQEYVLPHVYEGNQYAYQDWIKAPRVKNIFMPEIDDGKCLYQMRAGMIKFREPVGGCPKYVAVNPTAFY